MGFFQRLGFNKIKIENPVWFHCSSLGEVNAVKNVILKLKKYYNQIYITTLTDTGYLNSKKLVQENCAIIPFDFNFLVRNFIKRLNPKILIIEETELWPNLIWQTYKMGIPIIYINAFISRKSFKFYKFFSFVFSKILKAVEIFFVQNEETKEYLIKLGIRPEKIKYIGVTKFDIEIKKAKRLNKIFPKNSKVIIGGSTHKGEEEIIIEVFKKLKDEFPNLKLIIAPRHIERINEIKNILYNENLKFSLSSKISKKIFEEPILVVDQLGVLIDMYAISDICIIGGTMVPIGGHNPLEPAALKKPIIFGEYIKNNYLAFQLLLKNKASIMVKNKIELYNQLHTLLKNDKLCKRLGKKAYYILKKNQGASRRIAEYIWKNYLKK